MWTAENRREYERSGWRYPSDLTEAEWALAAPLIPPAAKHGGRKRSVDVREGLDGIFYVLATGCPWRALPKDLPPRSAVHGYLQLWDWDGTLARLHHALYVRARELAGKEAGPTAAILDSQSVKGAERGGSASTRPATTRARRSRARSATSWPTRPARSSPPTFTRRAPRTGTGPRRCRGRRAGCSRSSSARSPMAAAGARSPRRPCGRSGLGGWRSSGARIGRWASWVLPQRWIVGRTFAWLGRCRRLAEDVEPLTRPALAFLRPAIIRLMLRRIARASAES